MIIFIFILSVHSGRLVQEWFAQDRVNWLFVREECQHIALLFSDDAWLSLTLQTVRELDAHGVCCALVLWLQPNSTVPELCTKTYTPCFVDNQHTAPTSWGSRHYFTKIAQRLPIVSDILHALPLDAQRGVALIDSDVAFLRRNFFARIVRNESCTFIAQQEWPCATAPLRACVNGGVWWMRRTELGRTMLREAQTLMRTLAIPDQDALTLVSGQHARETKFLDRLKYANGYTVQRDAQWRRAAAHMVHANWLTGINAKAEFLARIRHGPKN